MSSKKRNNFVYYYCKFTWDTVVIEGKRRLCQDNVCNYAKLNQVGWFILILEEEFSCQKVFFSSWLAKKGTLKKSVI